MGMKNWLICLWLCVFMSACGGNSSSTEIVRVISVDKSADANIVDVEINDNLTLEETECSLDVGSGNSRVTLFYTSELLGDGYFVSQDISFPPPSDWENDELITSDNSDECNAPGYRALKAIDLKTAQSSISSQEFLYGCGGSCKFEMESKTVSDDGKFEKYEIQWICTGIFQDSCRIELRSQSIT